MPWVDVRGFVVKFDAENFGLRQGYGAHHALLTEGRWTTIVSGLPTGIHRSQFYTSLRRSNSFGSIWECHSIDNMRRSASFRTLLGQTLNIGRLYATKSSKFSAKSNVPHSELHNPKALLPRKKFCHYSLPNTDPKIVNPLVNRLHGIACDTTGATVKDSLTDGGSNEYIDRPDTLHQAVTSIKNGNVLRVLWRTSDTRSTPASGCKSTNFKWIAEKDAIMMRGRRGVSDNRTTFKQLTVDSTKHLQNTGHVHERSTTGEAQRDYQLSPVAKKGSRSCLLYTSPSPRD